MAEGCQNTGIGLWLRQQLRPGCVMFDIGANIGNYTALSAHMVGSTGHVYAFEPAPDNVAYLRARFAALPQVTVIAAAVSDMSGVGTLFLDRRNNTQHSLAAANVGKRGDAVAVQQVTLDAYRDEVQRLDVVKIDAQGAELHILRGARRLLTTFRPSVALELWPLGLQNYGGSAEAVLAELKALGYALHRLSAKGLKAEDQIQAFLETPGRWRNINIAAIPRA